MATMRRLAAALRALSRLIDRFSDRLDPIEAARKKITALNCLIPEEGDAILRGPLERKSFPSHVGSAKDWTQNYHRRWHAEDPEPTKEGDAKLTVPQERCPGVKGDPDAASPPKVYRWSRATGIYGEARGWTCLEYVPPNDSPHSTCKEYFVEHEGRVHRYSGATGLQGLAPGKWMWNQFPESPREPGPAVGDEFPGNLMGPEPDQGSPASNWAGHGVPESQDQGNMLPGPSDFLEYGSDGGNRGTAVLSALSEYAQTVPLNASHCKEIAKKRLSDLLALKNPSSSQQAEIGRLAATFQGSIILLDEPKTERL